MLTQMPIFRDESCRLVLLRKQIYEKPSHYHHASDVWMPLGLPITGNYDDYGDLLHDTIVQDFSYRFLREQVLKIHKLNIADLGTDKNTDRIGDVFAWNYDDKKLIATRTGEKTVYGVAFISGQVYDHVIQYERKGLIPVFGWKNNQGRTMVSLEDFLRDQLQTIAPQLKLYAHFWALWEDQTADLQNDPILLEAPWTDMAIRLKAKADDPTSDMEERQRELFQKRDFFFEAQRWENVIRDALSYRTDHFGWSRRLLKALAQDETDEGSEAWIDLYCLHNFIAATRKMWLPQGAMGSRSDDMSAYQTLVDVMQQRITDRLQWHKDYFGD